MGNSQVSDCDQLRLAAKEGRINDVMLLIQEGVIKDDMDFQALYFAAQNNHYMVVKHLNEQGADMEQANNDGVTPLIVAAANGHIKVVVILIMSGANKDKHCCVLDYLKPDSSQLFQK